jgi:hypothetical protein
VYCDLDARRSEFEIRKNECFGGYQSVEDTCPSRKVRRYIALEHPAVEIGIDHKIDSKPLDAPGLVIDAFLRRLGFWMSLVFEFWDQGMGNQC